jgi:LETM1 and EF-hand domain-containing protein 1, mitochondrial
MLEKKGTEGEEEAKRAYIAAREVADHAAEVAAGNKISSALIEKVCLSVSLLYVFYVI